MKISASSRGIASATARLACLALPLLATALPARALVIDTTFDSSITGMPNATTIEQAFDTAASRLEHALSNPVTVNIDVSWGKVSNRSLPANTVESASLDVLDGYYTYSQVEAALTAAATTANDRTALQHLPAAPASGNRYLIPSAEAKALGLIAASGTAINGYIGFSGATSNYSFSDQNGTPAGSFDFVAMATHEIDEVLGRVSGLTTASPLYATPFDLFRYAAVGVTTFAYGCATHTPPLTSCSYASINGGVTNLGAFNNSLSGGDRGDWAKSITTDVQDAFISRGQNLTFSNADLTLLDVLGWTPAPEPASVSMLALGAAVLGTLRRRARRSA